MDSTRVVDAAAPPLPEGRAGRHGLAIELECITAAPVPLSGTRVLVERSLPIGRAISRRSHIWAPTVAPSARLSRWYGQQQGRLPEFTRRYRMELEHSDHADTLEQLRHIARDGVLVLQTACYDLALSHLGVLAARIGVCGHDAGPG